MDSNKISVILPIYNVENYIQKCVESVMNQTYKNFEVIAVNDGSTDNSVSIFKKIVGSDNRFRFLNQENMGLSAARNNGISLVTGNLITFLDSDDYYHNDAFSFYNMIFTKYNVDSLITDFTKVKNGSYVKENSIKFEGIYKSSFVLKEIMLDKIGSQVWNKVFKNNNFPTAPFPINRRFEDIPTTYKFFLDKKSVYLTNESFYYYTIRDTSISNTNNQTNRIHRQIGFKDRFIFLRNSNLSFLSKISKKKYYEASINLGYSYKLLTEKDRTYVFNEVNLIRLFDLFLLPVSLKYIIKYLIITYIYSKKTK